MTVQTIIDADLFITINSGDSGRTISGLFCCDLLSIAMSKAPANCAWVTVMGNINTLAVASLADVSCIILAEGVNFDDASIKKAKEHEISIFTTTLPIFDASLKVHELV
ncbi:MAG: hypothetical protein PHX08_16230 [Lachnospiraceae bacterium]|nr:hypothetical protein [Lachnospiraceae bacterium]